MDGKKEVLVTELEVVRLGEMGDFLTDEERVGMADEVFGELKHEFGCRDGTVVDLDESIGSDEFDGAVGRNIRWELVDACYVVAHQMKTPWNGV